MLGVFQITPCLLLCALVHLRHNKYAMRRATLWAVAVAWYAISSSLFDSFEKPARMSSSMGKCLCCVCVCVCMKLAPLTRKLLALSRDIFYVNARSPQKAAAALAANLPRLYSVPVGIKHVTINHRMALY